MPNIEIDDKKMLELLSRMNSRNISIQMNTDKSMRI